MITKNNMPKYKFQILIFGIVLSLRLASEATANLSFFLIAVWALFGRVQAIQALALVWLCSMLNAAVVPEATMAAVGRYAVFAAAAISVFFESTKTKRGSRMTQATIFLSLALLAHSLFVSPIVDVSALKVISWSVVTATLFTAWSILETDERHSLESQLFGGLIAILVVSLPMLALPQGYAINETGFQGVLTHPQAFGPVMALLGVWTGARVLAASRPNWLLLILLGTCLVLVVFSEARTGGLSMVIGLAGAIMMTPLLTRQPLRLSLPGVASIRVHFLLGIAVIGALLSGSALTDRLGEYLDKRGDQNTGLANIYQTSRGELIDTMIHNIDANPLLGIGFGIASYSQDMLVIREPLLGLPISAAIEKGVLPLAIVEELGFVGSSFVFAWLVLLVVIASRAGVTALALVFTTFLLNFGESTFFSPSGLGLLPLILIAWAATAPPAGKSAEMEIGK
jgi:hypothetical protein